MFVEEGREEANGSPVVICVRNSEGRPGLNCVFTEEGIAGMLEAADIKIGYNIAFVWRAHRSHMC